MVVGDYGYRKVVYLQGYSHELLDTLTNVQLRVRRPDGTTFSHSLLPADRDQSGNFTWLIAQGDLTIEGEYLFQAVGLSGTRQVGACAISIHVCGLLELA